MSRSEPKTIRPLPDDGPAAVAGQAAPGGAEPGFDQLRHIIVSLVSALRRRRHVFFTLAGGLFALASLAIALQTPLYESTAQLIVKVGRELVYQPEVGSDKAVVPRDTQAVINSELAILRSQPVMEGVVRRVGLEVLYPDLVEAWTAGASGAGGAGGASGASGADEPTDAQQLVLAEAAERLRGALSTTALPETDVLQLSFQHPDPLVARSTVDALVEEFLSAHLNAFAQPEIAKFLASRVETYERRLMESEGALRAFQSQHPAFAHDQPQIVLLEERDRVRLQVDDLEQQISTVRFSQLQDDAAISDARSQLLRLRVEESQLKGERQEAAREQRAVIQRFIDDRMREVDRQLQPLIAKLGTLNVRLEEIQAELSLLPVLSAEHRKLERERNSDEEQLTHAVGRLRDARLSSEMDSEKIASVNVIQPASVAPRPVWPPSKPISIAVVGVLSLVVGVLGVSFLDRVGPVGIAFLDRQRPLEGEAS